MKEPTYHYNENLFPVPDSIEDVEAYISDLKISGTHKEVVSKLGKLAFYQMLLEQFSESESNLRKALEIISSEKLSILQEVQQNLRLAQVCQAQQKFIQSNELFDKLFKIIEKNDEAEIYLDFLYQHSGKNQFDQGHYSAALDMFTKALSIRLDKRSPEDQIESTRYAIRRTNDRLNKNKK